MRQLSLSKHFREAALTAYPGLRGSDSYRMLFQELCFPSTLDGISEQPMLASRFIYKITQQNRNALEFLEAYRLDVSPTFAWSKSSGEAGLARICLNNGISEDFQQVIATELTDIHDDTGIVYFVSGKASNAKSRLKTRQQEHDEAVKMQAACRNPDAMMIMDYLNSLPATAFTKTVNENYEAARQLITMMFSENKHRHLSQLEYVMEQAQPFYHPSDNSDRLFPLYTTLCNIKSEVRQVLTQQWTELDLQASQLRIFAHLANITLDLTDIWTKLVVHTGRPKHVVKEMVYALLYGKSEYNIKYQYLNGHLLLTHPLIQQILAARKRIFRKIVKDGGAHNCYGNWLSTSVYKPRQILAQQAQALEMKLIAPVFELAKTAKRWKVMLYQYDGISITFDERPEQHLAEIHECIYRKAAELGIDIRLETK